MTITTTGLSSNVCQPQYTFSQELVCAGRISGLDITENSGTITISEGSAYVKVQDSDGTEFMVKVYIDSDISLSSANSSDIIIKVPLANAQNGDLNLDLTNIAIAEIVPNGTGDDYHLVLATIDGAGSVSEVSNAGIYLPGCDYCIKCEGGVLQLPDTNINGNLGAEDIFAENVEISNDLQVDNDVNVGGVITGDGSGLTNVPLSASYMTETSTGLGEIATQSEVLSLTGDRVITTGNIQHLFEISPSWALLNSSYGGSTNNSTFTTLAEFSNIVGGTYRIAFMLGGDTGGGTAAYQVVINSVAVTGTNIGGTTTSTGSTIFYNNGTYMDTGLVSQSFWNSGTTGGIFDLYYADFAIPENSTIEIQGRDDGDTAIVNRVEIMGTPIIFPQTVI